MAFGVGGEEAGCEGIVVAAAKVGDVLLGEEAKINKIPALEGSIEAILGSLHAMVDAPIEEDIKDIKNMAKVLFSEISGSALL